MKYTQDVVYSDEPVDDTKRYDFTSQNSLAGWEPVVWVEKIQEPGTFLDILSWDTSNILLWDTRELWVLLSSEIKVLEAFEESFILQEEEFDDSMLLYGIIDEYPDLYHHYKNSHMSLYMFSTKSYSDVKKIFTLLAPDSPFSMNQVDNFWSASLYLNLEDTSDDGEVRILFEYENMAFWLKIKKDRYNIAKNILESLDS